MKKFFSLLLLVALFATLTILVSCAEEPVGPEVPENEVPHSHSFTKKEYIPTCSVEGYTEYLCRDCGYYYRDSFIPKNPNEHTHYDSTKGKNVTSLETTTYSAKNCQENTVRVTKCLDCGYEEKDEKGSVGPHVWDLEHPIESVDATCMTDGYIKYPCELCDAIRTDVVKHVGHIYGEWILDRNPVCSPTYVANGTKHRTCINCPWTEMEDVLPHYSTKDPILVVAPTCTEVGYSVYVCDHCGTEYVRDYLDALGHEWCAWHDLEGSVEFESRECTLCGLAEVRAKKD
jgi:Zn ribbon nucleic-acid-binding protein